MYPYNKELSEAIGKKYKGLFRQKECYQNVFRMASRSIEELRPQAQLKILFCFAYNDIYHYRHAFCVHRGQIIEPLSIVTQNLKMERIVPIYEFEFNKYLHAITTEGYFDLCHTLLPHEIKAFNNNKIDLNPVDLCHLVQSVTKTTDDMLKLLADIINGGKFPANAG